MYRRDLTDSISLSQTYQNFSYQKAIPAGYLKVYRLATHVAFRDRYFGELPNQIIVRYFLSSKWQGVKYQIS